MASFDERLKCLRTEHNMLQKDISENCDIGLRTIKGYESGKVKPTSTVLIKLCRYFNVSADYLLGLSDEPRPLVQDNSDKT